MTHITTLDELGSLTWGLFAVNCLHIGLQSYLLRIGIDSAVKRLMEKK